MEWVKASVGVGQGPVKVGVGRVLGLRRGLRIVLGGGEFWSEVLRSGLKTGLGKVSRDSKQTINPLQTEASLRHTAPVELASGDGRLYRPTIARTRCGRAAKSRSASARLRD